jgi:tRNA(Ile)-lysidine synthase
MVFTPLTLKNQLLTLDGVSRLVVALSGGLDSCVLLNSLVQLRKQAEADEQVFPFTIEALHVNHGLSPNAMSWERFCERLCKTLGIPLQIVRVTIDASAGASLENLARIKRYEAFELSLAAGDCLLMGHHQDDQAETFLLRALRGSGPRGLAAIPRQRLLGDIVILRPFLDVPRAQMLQYGRDAGLEWIEDESNANVDFDRNYCRHVVLPTIEQRWPGFASNWARSAALCAEADELMEEVAQQDLRTCSTASPNILQCEQLLALSQARQRNLLRFWVMRMGLAQLGWNTLTQVVESLLLAKEDAQGRVSWVHEQGRIELRRYHGQLILLEALPPIDVSQELEWSLGQSLTLGANGLLSAETIAGLGLKKPPGDSLRVRYRQGGEKLRLAGRPNRALKKILQDAELAPWWRDRIPLLFAGEELVCVPGIGVAENWLAQESEPAYRITWTRPSSEPQTKK